MTIAYVQDALGLDVNTVTLSSPSTVGNTLIACGRTYDLEVYPDITDSAGNVWTYPTEAGDGPPPFADPDYPDWIAYALDAASVTTITDSNDVTSMDVSEFAGITGVGAGAAATGSSGEPTVSVPYDDGDLIVANCYPANTPTGSPPGFTAMPNGATPNTWPCYQVMSGSGTADIVWPAASGGWSAVAQVFSASPSPSEPSGLLMASGIV